MSCPMKTLIFTSHTVVKRVPFLQVLIDNPNLNKSTRVLTDIKFLRDALNVYKPEEFIFMKEDTDWQTEATIENEIWVFNKKEKDKKVEILEVDINTWPQLEHHRHLFSKESI
jgi:hypothetical protein